jgi:hypothetical protein
MLFTHYYLKIDPDNQGRKRRIFSLCNPTFIKVTNNSNYFLELFLLNDGIRFLADAIVKKSKIQN